MRTRRAYLSRIGAGRAALLLAVVVAFVALAAVAAYAVVTTLDAYEPDDTPATAKPLDLGAAKQMRTLHYTTGGDVDWVTFQAQQGKGYIIETGDLNPSTTDTVLELYAGDASTLLAENDDFGFSFASRIAWKAPATGTYYVRVKGRHAGINGNYSLTLREAGAITGTVTEQGTGTALSGITVDLWQWDQDGYYVFFETQTNASGQYEFGAVPPGTWRVGFYDWSGGYVGRYYNNKATVEQGNNVTVSAGATASGINASLAPAPKTVKAVPIEGADRYLTAIAGSEYAFPSGASAVVIATGEDFADALGGAALAGALDAPLLITRKAALPDSVAAEIRRLGATKAYILGGTGAVSESVAMSVSRALTGTKTVTRIAGTSRYDTADLIAAETISLLGASYTGGAFVATGANFPDALGASPVAAAKGMPVILANPQRSSVTLPPQVTRVVIAGGTGAVPASIEASLKSTLGTANVTRLSGLDRYDTAAKVAAYGASIGMTFNGVGIATGANFPDALSAGPVLGTKSALMLLTGATVPAPTSKALSDNKAAISTVHFFGGTGAVPLSVRQTVLNLVK